MAALTAASAPPRKPTPNANAAPREKKAKTMPLDSTGAVKLGSLKVHAGLLCREEEKPADGEGAEGGGDGSSAEDAAAELKEAFESLDEDGSGALNKAELGAALAKIGVHHSHHCSSLPCA